MLKRKRAEALPQQAELSDFYPELENEQTNIAGVRQLATEIVSQVVQGVRQEAAPAAPALPEDELPAIVKQALQAVALEKTTDRASLAAAASSNATRQEPLDLTAKLKAAPARQTVTLKIAQQNYVISADADVAYMQAIAAEANLLLSEVKQQLPRGDQQMVFVLALLNALDEKATMTFKLNEQEDLLQQSLKLNRDLQNLKAVLERRILSYKQKLADLATVFTRISERFAEYKLDNNFSTDNFQKLVLQIISGEEAENPLAQRQQLSLQDCLQAGREKQNE